MNARDAADFFDQMQQELKEEFTIPKRKKEDVAADNNGGGDDKSNEIKSVVANKDEKKEFKSNTPSHSPAKKLKDGGGDDDDHDDVSKAKKRKRSAVDSDKNENVEEERDGDTVALPQARSRDPLGLEAAPAAMTYGEAKGARFGTETWKSLYDGDIPMELEERCSEERCGLCGEVTFTSAINAKTHYLGR